MKMIISVALVLASAFQASAAAPEIHADRSEVRSGNRKFSKGEFGKAEIDYRKAVLKDSTSVAASYNLASALYREGKFDEAAKSLESVKEEATASANAASYHFNCGDVALQRKDYAAAVEAFRQALLIAPDDLAAKENYTYAKKMLQNQQNQQNQQDQQEDQQDQQNQQDQQDQQDRQDQQNQPEQQKISPQQAQQMLKAIQAQEKETQDKVKKEKAAVMQSRQKEKNW